MQFKYVALLLALVTLSACVTTANPQRTTTGKSMADPVLMRDAAPMVMGFAIYRSQNKDCRRVHVVDMKVTKMPDKNGVWQERWAADACGKVVPVNITFAPDKKRGGTTFIIDHKR